jgi:hypothetical protein
MPTGITIATPSASGADNMANDFIVQYAAPGSLFPGATAASGMINPRGQQIVAMGLPPKAESVRLGKGYECSIATGSAFTHIAAWPTSRAELVLYNAAADGVTCLVIDSAWAANVATSIAAANTYTLLGQLVSSGTAPTDDTAQLIQSLSGKAGSNGSGNVKRAVANTSYGIASKWSVLNSITSGNATATIGEGVVAEIGGKYIVPPGGLFLLNLVVGTATGTSSIGVTWHEFVLGLNA